jgi:luciferase family oxidoreductase group 1
MSQVRLKQCKFSLLELAPIPQGSTAKAAFERALALSQHAEGLGYHRIWVAEHHNMRGIASSATSVLIGYLAAHTTRIRLGSGGIMLPNHAPLVVAEQFGTLATLYPDRIDLGLGRAPGTDSFTMQALRRGRHDSESQFPDDVLELLSYLAEPSAQQKILATPGQASHVPVYLLGSSLFSAQLAAQLGLPYAFASHFAPRLMQQAIQHYRQHFQASKALQHPYVLLGIPCVLAATDAQAQYLATSNYQRVLALIRGQPITLPPPVESMQGLWSPAEQAAVHNFLAAAHIGSVDTVAAQLKALLQQTQADELIFTHDIYDSQQRLESVTLLKSLQNDDFKAPDTDSP